MRQENTKRIKFSTKYLRSFKKLPHNVQFKLEARELIFKDNIFDVCLDTHKLHGKDRDCWAYSIDRNYRIKFMFKDDGSVLYLNIGTHDEVY